MDSNKLLKGNNMLESIKVSNLTSSSGNKVPNQFSIRVKSNSPDQVGFDRVYFQSYDSIICYKDYDGNVVLDEYYWDYSVTTAKYRNQFLNETTKETKQKIKDGTYKLTNLN